MREDDAIRVRHVIYAARLKRRMADVGKMSQCK